MDTTLQVPINKNLKILAQKAAFAQGFSSLQEAVRIFLTKLANRTMTFNFIEQTSAEILTSKQEKVLDNQLLQAEKEIANGKYIKTNNLKKIMNYLEH